MFLGFLKFIIRLYYYIMCIFYYYFELSEYKFSTLGNMRLNNIKSSGCFD